MADVRHFPGVNVMNESDVADALLNPLDFHAYKTSWDSAQPFHHIVLDSFLTEGTANEVVREFPALDDKNWYVYDNAIEIKKALNNWDRFPGIIYKLFWYLSSPEFVSQLEVLTDCKLYADFGLNGGGLHSHRSGGKLNTHLDYSLHPKLRLERRLNLLVYVTPDWNESWGGHLGLWNHDAANNRPGKLVTSISPAFNRAVLFDTTQNSWHGLPEPIACPPDVTRNSLAIYYLCDPRDDAADRGRAQFVPHKEQNNDPQVLELIKKRSSVETSSSVYVDKEKL